MPAQQPPNAAMKENTALFPELKPCPFCGGKPELRFDNFGGPGCYILCACNSFGVVAQTFSFSTVESASDAWNTRFSTMPAQQPLNAAMNETVSPSTSAFESEAKTKWCPFSREVYRYRSVGFLTTLNYFFSANRDIEGNPSSCSLCLGSSCIAWDKDEGCLMIRRPVSSIRIWAEKNA